MLPIFKHIWCPNTSILGNTTYNAVINYTIGIFVN